MDRETVYGALKRLKSEWVSRGWSWDRRFECVASTFDKSLANQALGVIRTAFPHEWTSSNLRKAPPTVAEVAEMTGGVRSDQFLYATDELDGLLAFGLWWPWGGEGSNISLRIGIAGHTSYDDTVKVRQIFNAMDD